MVKDGKSAQLNPSLTAAQITGIPQFSETPVQFPTYGGHFASHFIMSLTAGAAILANFLLIGGLVFYGFTFFARYHATGKWAKNITSLLAGVGMLSLAFALTITPRNVDVLARIATTKASRVFLVVSSILLLAAIAAFGILTYWRPLRLRHERKLERDLSDDLPNIR